MTTIRIDGATRPYAIVGDPIVQVKSLEIFSALFASAGMNA
jgi:shikimate 5-dehydrogenase